MEVVEFIDGPFHGMRELASTNQMVRTLMVDAFERTTAVYHRVPGTNRFKFSG